LITGPQGFERTATFLRRSAQAHRTPRRAPAHGRRTEETLGGCLETKDGDASAGEGRQDEAPPQPRGARADHRGDEEAVGGAEEGRIGCDAGGGQTGPEARCLDKRGQENQLRRLRHEKGLAGRRRRAEATGGGEGVGREGCGTGAGTGWERARRRHGGIADGHPAARPAS
jgi:hypothetical protein